MSEPDDLGATPREERAAEVVRLGLSGQLGEAGRDLAALFGVAHQRAMVAEQLSGDECEAREGIEREANALAAAMARLLSGERKPTEVATELPDAARLRVNAYRHQFSGMPGATARDSKGRRLPVVPPAASVMRSKVRVVDV